MEIRGKMNNKFAFKPNTEEQCLLETLIAKVIKSNQDGHDGWRAAITINIAGVNLSLRGYIIGNTSWKLEKKPSYRSVNVASEKEHLEHMIAWLDERYTEEHADES